MQAMSNEMLDKSIAVTGLPKSYHISISTCNDLKLLILVSAVTAADSVSLYEPILSCWSVEIDLKACRIGKICSVV